MVAVADSAVQARYELKPPYRDGNNDLTFEPLGFLKSFAVPARKLEPGTP